MEERLLMTKSDEDSAAIALTRSEAYKVLSRLWISEVDETLWQGLLATEFPSVPENPVLTDAYRALEEYIREAKPEHLSALAADYAMLCRGVDPVRGADPYESVHRNPMRLMMQDEWEAVLLLYREFGFVRSEDAVEPEDHLGIELECMAHLCERCYHASIQGDSDARSSARAMQRTLLEDHLLKWVPLFVSAVLKDADTEFYKAVALITQEYLRMDWNYLHSSLHPLEGC
jgi:TorA maturation chaperone TorD